MDHFLACRPVLRAAILFAALAAAVAAQSVCSDFGSVPVSATVEASPTTLDCPAARPWPDWHLFTPAHRAPQAHVGFRPGDARALPRVIVVYRCTGFLLVPVLPIRVRVMGYVIDQPEISCVTS
jgi:hypothetical protein